MFSKQETQALSKKLREQDKARDSEIMKDFGWNDADQEDAESSDIFNKPKYKSAFDMPLEEVEGRVSRNDLKYAIRVFAEMGDEAFEKAKLEKNLEEFARLTGKALNRAYNLKDKEAVRILVNDTLFIQSVGKDSIAKAVLTSELMSNVFKVNRDMFSHDVKAGNAFYDEFKAKIEDAETKLGHDNWDDLSPDEIEQNFGRTKEDIQSDMDNVFFDRYESKDKDLGVKVANGADQK